MAISDFSSSHRSTPLMLPQPACRVSLTETWWGYVIRNERIISPARRLMTVGAGFLAVCFGIAGVALWVAPAAAFSGEAVLMKGAGSSVMAVIALMLLRVATEEPVVEIQVDLHRAEIREVARRSGDKPRLRRRHGFEEIGGLFFDRSGPGRLVARYGNTSQLLTIAEGSGPAVERIRDRVGRDVIAGRPATEEDDAAA